MWRARLRLRSPLRSGRERVVWAGGGGVGGAPGGGAEGGARLGPPRGGPGRTRRGGGGGGGARAGTGRVVFPPGGAPPPQPANLEHLFAPVGEEACEAGAERACPLDRERAPTRRVLFDQSEGVRVAVAVRDDGRLEHERTTDDVHDGECVRVTVRIDTDHEVHFICKHP